MTIEYDLKIDVAENGSSHVLKCRRCKKVWARVFLGIVLQSPSLGVIRLLRNIIYYIKIIKTSEGD